MPIENGLDAVTIGLIIIGVVFVPMLLICFAKFVEHKYKYKQASAKRSNTISMKAIAVDNYNKH